MYTSDTLANYLLADTHRKVSHMSNNTPEERACQPPKGIVVDNSKAVIDKGLTHSELTNIVQEVAGHQIETPVSKVIEACNQPAESPAKKKAIEESRKLIESFAQNLKNYPKHLSYEGSVVLCVMVSINETESISINGLPSVDRELILSQLPDGAIKKLQEFHAHLKVEFDEARDFILTYTPDNEDRGVTLRFFNTVIHPQQIDKAVAVERDGEKISLGGKFQFDKKSIQRKIGLTDKHETDDDTDDSLPPRRQPIAGRNAYEIRADVLQMAIDWASRNNQAVKTPDDVLTLAKKFYSFVEDRNRR